MEEDALALGCFEDLLGRVERHGLLELTTLVGYQSGAAVCTNWSPGACSLSSQKGYSRVSLAELTRLERCAECTWDEVLLEAGVEGEIGLSTLLRVLEGSQGAEATVAGMSLSEVDAHWDEAYTVLVGTPGCEEALERVRAAVGAELSGRLLKDLVKKSARELTEAQMSWLTAEAKGATAALVAADERRAVIKLRAERVGWRFCDGPSLVSALVASTALDDTCVLAEVPLVVAEAASLTGPKWLRAHVGAVAVLEDEDTPAVLESLVALVQDEPRRGLEDALEVARAL
jgi:hypothetical protein